MPKVIKAQVLAGQFEGQVVRITNISVDDMGRRRAACMLPNGQRANIYVKDLQLLEEAPEPEIRKAKTASMPFITGSTSSRSMTHTRNMAKLRPETKSSPVATKYVAANCEKCGKEYNVEERKGMPGRLTECEDCATETESKMEGTMIFSHKTGATIEIKKDGELKHEAQIFDPKNKV